MKFGEKHLFIPRTSTPDQLALLQRAFDNKRICSVFGASGSGKTELLVHWLSTLPPQTAESVLHVELSPPSSEYRSGTHMVYARLLDAMLIKSAPSYVPRPSTEQDLSERFGKKQLEILRKRVTHELHRRAYPALVFDRIEYLDLHAFHWVVDLRYDPYSPRKIEKRALFFVGQLLNKDERHRIDGWLHRRGDTHSAWLERVDVRRPNIRELNGTRDTPGIARRLIREGVKVSVPDVPERPKISEQLGELIEQTKGNLWSLERLLRLLDDEVERTAGSEIRAITLKTIERVRKRLDRLDGPRRDKQEQANGDPQEDGSDES